MKQDLQVLNRKTFLYINQRFYGCNHHNTFFSFAESNGISPSKGLCVAGLALDLIFMLMLEELGWTLKENSRLGVDIYMYHDIIDMLIMQLA